MSRTYRTSLYHSQFTSVLQYKAYLETRFYNNYTTGKLEPIYTDEYIKNEVKRWGTEASNWSRVCTQALKAHSSRKRRTDEKRALHESYYNWEHEFIYSDRILKHLIWCYD